ncbi:MAG: thioredoxin domain-containing protein [Deltaproteobacteria bacterium]|nr:thioredoxin domain-containing protein [Deltaproteobacteria bacterium]
MKKIIAIATFLILILISATGFAQEDKIVRVAIETARSHMRIPKEMEVRFVEKKKSPLAGFYSVKILVLTPDREMPVIVYVDEAGEKVILGPLIIKGENVAVKEAGEAKPRKFDMNQFEIEKSAIRGNPGAKVTIVEFSNFWCSYCQVSWAKMEKMLENHPQTIRYIFKHFPLKSLQGSFELSEIAASAQVLGGEAFWMIHDFFFSPEGQMIIREDVSVVIRKVEEILRERGFDVKAFQSAMEKGMGKRRVMEDIAVGNRVPVMGTPSLIVNGDFISGEFNDQVLERYLRK